jgi:peroxisomal 2,4-dienoyl-CoA reductase
MSVQRTSAPAVDLAATFKPDMFKGKVLFCTGGGSGICKGMTEAIVRPHT